MDTLKITEFKMTVAINKLEMLGTLMSEYRGTDYFDTLVEKQNEVISNMNLWRSHLDNYYQEIKNV